MSLWPFGDNNKPRLEKEWPFVLVLVHEEEMADSGKSVHAFATALTMHPFDDEIEWVYKHRPDCLAIPGQICPAEPCRPQRSTDSIWINGSRWQTIDPTIRVAMRPGDSFLLRWTLWASKEPTS